MEIELPDEKEEIGTYEPSRAEVRKAIGHLKNGKAPCRNRQHTGGAA